MLADVFHCCSILYCIPIDCSLTNISGCWPRLVRSLDAMSILVSNLLFYTVIEQSFMVSARACPGSTCISPVWLERCKLSLSLSLSLSRSLDVMSILVSVVLFYTMTNTLLWDLLGDAMAAPHLFSLCQTRLMHLRYLGPRENFHLSQFPPTCGWKV